ncbi:MFS transporter [Erythrobacter sp. WG]|uniref:MFS transporter n=1 Tax=Erythrobacter sp. WG TaxID=2985510 RepID=UPI00226D89CB|nr:MFS transporter [Erythrobacter sp. WG]MCX9147421.1 MFS transporter [Erythrobacter sp. WG]
MTPHASPDDAAPPPALTPRQKNLALMTLIVAVVLEIVDLTIVNTALPAITTGLGASAEAVQWIVAGYALSFALLLMAGGRLGDALGYRQVFLLGVTGFTLASVACGLAQSPSQLVLARLAQGASGAIMSPQALALMQVLFTPLERVSKLALFGLVGGLAAIAGPVLGGLLIELDLFGLGWRLIFLINLPVGIFALVSGFLFLPDRRSARAGGFDGQGIVLFGLAVLCLLWPLTRAERGWGMAEPLLMALAVPLAALTWRHAGARVRAGRAAVFDPSLLAIRPFRLGLAISTTFATASAGFLLTFAFALQTERGESPLATGLLHMPYGLGAMLGIAVLGRNFLPRIGKWVLVAGGVTMMASVLVILAGIGPWAWPWTLLVAPLVLGGTGMGSLSGCIAPVTLAQVDRDHAGAASGMLKTSQQIGSALGIALNGSVYFLLADGGGLRPSLGAGLVTASLLALATLLALRLPGVIFRPEPALAKAA